MGDYRQRVDELRRANEHERRSRAWTARVALAGSIFTILFGALLATDCHAADGQQAAVFMVTPLLAAIGAGVATRVGRRKRGWLLSVVVAFSVGVGTLLAIGIVFVGECGG
jgi:hypothetical protein